MSVRSRVAGSRKRAAWQGPAMESAPAQRELESLLRAAHRVLDLGSGSDPVLGAGVAVDLILDPRQRAHGRGDAIDPQALAARGIQFINQSIDKPLPFERHEFDFVYCSHVIEHVDNPGAACDEMMRVAKTGLLRCPNAMAEYLYGREYHRWLVLERGGVVVFLEKTPDEFALFGRSDARAPADVNPFEAMLDWQGGRPSTGHNRIIARLRARLQELFYRRAPQSEINLFWRSGFEWLEIRKDGVVARGGRPGTQYSFDESGSRVDHTTEGVSQRA
jgi:SAM-dependent methyltransferase